MVTRHPFLIRATLLAVGALIVLASAPTGEAATGGPDLQSKGYRWADGPDGPNLPFTSIAGNINALPLAMTKDGYAPKQTLRFPFKFYDNDVDELYINNNGFVMFEAFTDIGTFPGKEHPAIGDPSGFISGCWGDLKSKVAAPNGNSGNVYILNQTTRFVVEWNAYQQSANNVPVTFQIIINNDNTLDVVIDDCPIPGTASWSVGIEGFAANTGLSYFYDKTAIPDAYVRFYPNKVPVAATVTATTLEDTPVTVDVMAAASDPDGDALFLTGVVTPPTHGTAFPVAGGVLYTPDADTNDDFRAGMADAFEYEVRDAWGATAKAWAYVNVTPVNDPPTFARPADGIIQVLEDASNDADLLVDRIFVDVLPGPPTALDEMSQLVTITQVAGTPSTKSTPGYPLFDLAPTLQSPNPIGADNHVGIRLRTYPDMHGLQGYDVKLEDDHPSDPRNATSEYQVRVLAVNDAPYFEVNATAAISDPIVAEDALIPVPGEPGETTRIRTFSIWMLERMAAKNATTTAADEAVQALTITVTGYDASLFGPGGAPQILSDGTLQFTPATDAYGSTPFTVTLRDDNSTGTPDDDLSLSFTHTILIQPTNDPPVAVLDERRYLLRQGTLVIDVVANDTLGPDSGETLTLHGLSSGGMATIIDSMGGLAEVDGGKIHYDNGGTTTGTVEIPYWIKDDGDSYSESSMAFDDDEMTAQGILRIILFDGSMAGQPDLYTIAEDTILEPSAAMGVLANDASSEGVVRFAVLERSVVRGTLQLGDDGSFRYQPLEDFSGTDTFSYRVEYHNASGFLTTTPPIEVEIHVFSTNDAPSARPDRYRVAPDEKALIPTVRGVLQNDFDADGDTMTATVAKPPRHGTLKFFEDGSFHYTPPPGFQGEDFFQYTVHDSSGPSNSATVTIIVAHNRGPLAKIGMDRDHTALVDGTAPFQFRDESVDPDGGIVAWFWDFGNGDTSREQHPTYIFQAAGEYPITLTVTDDAGVSSKAIAELTVRADWLETDGGTAPPERIPKADPGANQTVLQNALVQLGCKDLPGRLCHINTPPVIGYRWTQVGGPTVRLDDAFARFPTFQAPAVGPGDVVRLTFELVVFDAYQRSVPAPVTVLVQDSIIRPVANAGNDINRTEGTVLTLFGEALGYPPGAHLSYRWEQTGGPVLGLGTLEGQSFTFRATRPLGFTGGAVDYQFSLVVTDGVHETRPDTVLVTVQPIESEASGWLHRAGTGKLSERVIQFEPRVSGVLPTRISWDFGDGTHQNQTCCTDGVPTILHGYDAPGEYNVLMTLTYADGRTQAFPKTIEVGTMPQAFETAQSGIHPAWIVGGFATVGLIGAAVTFLLVQRRRLAAVGTGGGDATASKQE